MIHSSITYNHIQISPISINRIKTMIITSDLTSSYSIYHLSMHVIKILNCTDLHHRPWPGKLSLHHLYEFLESFSILSISYRYLVNVQRNFPCITTVYRVWPSHPWSHRLFRLHPPPLRPYHSLPWSCTPKPLHNYPSIHPCDHFAPLLTAIRPLYQKFHVPKSPVTSHENLSAADQKTSQKLVPAADMWQNCRYNLVQWLCGLLVGIYTADYLLY